MALVPPRAPLGLFCFQDGRPFSVHSPGGAGARGALAPGAADAPGGRGGALRRRERLRTAVAVAPRGGPGERGEGQRGLERGAVGLREGDGRRAGSMRIYVSSWCSEPAIDIDDGNGKWVLSFHYFEK